MKIAFTLLLGLCCSAAHACNSKASLPNWKPDFAISIDQVLDRMKHYSDNETDILVFEHGTAVLLPPNLKDTEANEFAKNVLSEIVSDYPDMNLINMDDGNMLIKYFHPAFNVVINDYANQHIEKIKQHHLNALAGEELLITPLGNNKFDATGMKALYGRSFMFMDAQHQKIAKIYRHSD